MKSFRENLLYFMKSYKNAKKETFKEHYLGKLVRRQIPENIYNQTNLDKNKYLVKGSVGQGNWAHVPWIALMNKEITASTQRGYYLVYLFSEDMSHVYLAFAQGVTETSLKDMKRINEEIRGKLYIHEPQIHKNNDYYLGESKFAVDYNKSTALYIKYSIEDFPSDDQLLNDLHLMLKYYEQFIAIKNEQLLPPIIEKFLSDFISFHVSENNFVEVYGEIKDVVVDLLETKKVEEPIVSQKGKDLLIKLPFVLQAESFYELKQYTTEELPDSEYYEIMQMLRKLLEEDDRDITKSSEVLHSLRILNYIDDNMNLNIDSFPDLYEQKQRFISIPIMKSILYLYDLTQSWDVNMKEQLVRELMLYTVVDAKDATPADDSTIDKKYSYIVDWLKDVHLINDNLQKIENDFSDDYLRGNETIESLREESNMPVNEFELVDHIYKFIRSRGFYYTDGEVKNFYLSLKSKPFVILSGISGTGKTKMVQWLSESVGATEENGRFTLIPVRPDWSDSSDLLGYVDIKGDFKEGPLTKVIKNADLNPGVPYFVLLDEMNLARVEYYFSDVLSVMESRKWEDGKIVSSHLLTKETADFDLKLPNNIYIIGTVNMDETTYPFSKKVLDRANTIEFNRIDLGNLAFLNETKTIHPLKVANDTFASKFLHLKDAYPNNKELIGQVIHELVRMNEILEIDLSHIGYRVRDEICFYIIHNAKANLFDFDTAFDYCILQKVLPRISGSDGLVEQLLRELYEMFTNTKFDEELDLQEVDVRSAKYPRSAQKVLEMYRRLNDGYTSFWIS